MKLSFFRINKINKISKNICFLLMILLTAVISCIIYIKLTKFYYREGYDNTAPEYSGSKGRLHIYVSDRSEYAADAAQNTADYGMRQINKVDKKVGGALDSFLDLISEKKEIPPQWKDFYGDGEMAENDIYKELPDTSLIINDSCSIKGFLHSEYKEDICSKPGQTQSQLNEKCKKLSIENCKIPSCCVLINGTKCFAGNANGPTFLTDAGENLDYKFYYNKNKCYGNCDISGNALSECDKYLHNSVGISKECMLQMFNKFGCSNPSPDYFINASMVKDLSLSSKSYVENHIKTEVESIANERYNLDNIIKCKGKTYAINNYRAYNTLLTPETTDEEIMDTLRTKNEIDLSHIYSKYYN